MFILKYIVFVSIAFAHSCLTISSKSQNETARFLWDLSNFAIQSRQNYGRCPYPYSYRYPGKYPQYYQNQPANSYSQYGGSTYPYRQRPHYHPQKGNYPYHYIPNSPPYRPLAQNIRESFMDVLLSVARNDDLQCVPKIICEVTSGTLSGRQQGTTLPVNINMESLLGFLSALNGLNSSPLLHFGKAALQGYTSKGNAGSCSYAYPDCPSDPDRLVQYLNNHNGGFFRYFGGSSPQNYPVKRRSEKSVAEQRIQNNPVDYIGDSLREVKGIKFPVRDEGELPNFDQSKLTFPTEEDVFSNELKPSCNEFFLYKSQDSLRFPVDDDINYEEQPFRKPKELPYDISFYHQDNELDLQKPLPNHKATPMIFPDRTGTGDLRLDPDELVDAEQPLRYEDDNVKITFNGFRDGRVEGKPFGSSGFGTHGEGGRGFLFPSR